MVDSTNLNKKKVTGNSNLVSNCNSLKNVSEMSFESG